LCPKLEIDLGLGRLASLVRATEPAEFGLGMIRVTRALCFAGDPGHPASLVSGTSTTQQTAGWLRRSLVELCWWAGSLGICGEELERAIEIKHAYNRTREHRHGGKKL